MAMRRDRRETNPAFNTRKLKLGTFQTNLDSGCVMSDLDGRLDISWPNTVALAKLGDEMEFEALVPVARWRVRPCCFNCAMGPGAGSGKRVSKRSSNPSARQTRRNPESCVATSPSSSRCTVLSETPACSASWTWVRFLSRRAAARRLPNSPRIASSVD